MKLFEIADPKDADLFHVHGGDDIFGALKASLMHDWIDVGLEAKQDLTMEQVDEDIINLQPLSKRLSSTNQVTLAHLICTSMLIIRFN